MTNEQHSVRDWMAAFGQETPEKPCIPSLEVRKLRAKLILEEALETIKALGFGITYSKEENNFIPIEVLEFEPNLLEIADGCEDLKVVTEGTLVACGLVNTRLHQDWGGYENDGAKKFDPLFDEVMRSNWSKFWTEKESKLFNSEYPDNQNSFVKVADNKYLVKNKDGKVIKSPSYSPANLQPIIDLL